MAACAVMDSLPNLGSRILVLGSEAGGHVGELRELRSAGPTRPEMRLELGASVIVLERSEDVSTKEDAELFMRGGFITHVCSLLPASRTATRARLLRRRKGILTKQPEHEAGAALGPRGMALPSLDEGGDRAVATTRSTSADAELVASLTAGDARAAEAAQGQFYRWHGGAVLSFFTHCTRRRSVAEALPRRHPRRAQQLHPIPTVCRSG